jgi:putative ABC transport system substrate-binding protein
VISALAVVGAPPAVRAQHARVYRIGWLGVGSPSEQTARLHEAFRRGLSDHGYVERRDFVIEFRWAHGRVEQLPALAEELARAPVDVIVAVTSQTAHAARGATASIPILLITPDPLSTGLVTNLARPGGNVTGITMVPGPEFVGKYLELMIDAVPTASRIAVLWSVSSPWQARMIRESEVAARSLRVEVQPVAFRDAGDFDGAFARMATERADAVIVLPDAITFVHRRQLAHLAARHRLPSLFTHLEAAADGALLAFATNIEDLFRRAARYVDRLMKGARAGDLAVEQPTTFMLIVNRKTANALGLAIPPSVLLRADRVIE